MVKIRLTRMGKKKQPSYRIVVADARCPRNGKVIENIGTYNPRNKRDAEGKDIENKMFVKQVSSNLKHLLLRQQAKRKTKKKTNC